MDNYKKYVLYCIPARLSVALALLLFHRSDAVRTAFAAIAILLSADFVYQIGKNFYATTGTCTDRLLRASTRPYAQHGFFKGVVWWHRLRYLHVLTWALVAALLITDTVTEWAGVVVALDVLPGLVQRIYTKRTAYARVPETEPADENILMFRF